MTYDILFTKHIAPSDPALASWVKDQTIVSSDWSLTRSNLLLVTKGADGLYSVLRAFYLSYNVVVSCDLKGATADAVIAHMVERRT